MGRLSESQDSLEKQEAGVVVPDPIWIFRDEVFEWKQRYYVQNEVFPKILECYLLVVSDRQVPFGTSIFEEEL